MAVARELFVRNPSEDLILSAVTELPTTVPTFARFRHIARGIPPYLGRDELESYTRVCTTRGVIPFDHRRFKFDERLGIFHEEQRGRNETFELPAFGAEDLAYNLAFDAMIYGGRSHQMTYEMGRFGAADGYRQYVESHLPRLLTAGYELWTTELWLLDQHFRPSCPDDGYTDAVSSIIVDRSDNRPILRLRQGYTIDRDDKVEEQRERFQGWFEELAKTHSARVQRPAAAVVE